MLGLSLSLWPRGVGASALGPGIVTAIEVLGDISISITSPSALSIPMQTNGSTLRIATSGVASHTALDLTKITLTVTDAGWDASGNQTTFSRTIPAQAKLIGPFNEADVYQPNLGEFYIKMADLCFNQDATWKTTITSVNFASGWLTGQPAGQVTTASITRSDSLSYLSFPIKIPTPPWSRVAAAGSFALEVTGLHNYPYSQRPWACVEAFVIDGNSNLGATVRSSTFSRSLMTPNDATLVSAIPVASYQLSVPVPTTGTPTYRAEARIIVKPWIGPPVVSATTTVSGTSYTGIGDAVFPSVNLPTSLPFCFDYDDSHTPLYGVIDYAGTGTIVHNLTLATADVSGLCATLAGAIASGKTYADYATFATAVRRLNNSGSNLTILSDNGLSTKSYKRPTAHTSIYTANGSIAGGVAVMVPVGSSVMGADLGAYSVRFSMLSQTNFPPGYVAHEWRSQSGLPTTDVRLRGRDSGGGATASKVIPSRLLLRGVNTDSTGVGVASDNIVTDGGGTNGAPTSHPGETAAVQTIFIDCQDNFVDPASVSASISILHYQRGWSWQIRSDMQNPSSGVALAQTAGVYCSNVISIGCNFFRKVGFGASVNTAFATLLGSKLTRCYIASQQAGVQPDYRGMLLYGVYGWEDTASNSNAMCDVGTTRPTRGSGGIAMAGFYFMGTTMAGSCIAIHNDKKRWEVDNFIVQHVAHEAPNIVSLSPSRWNIGYNEQGFVRIDKRFAMFACVSRCLNKKGDSFNAPETGATFSEGAWLVTNAYYKGSVVTSGGTDYQALQDIPANAAVGSGGALTDTAYWFNSGVASTTAYGQQPRRQGNNDWRYEVMSGYNCFASTDSSDSPSTTSWYGMALSTTTKFNQSASWPTSAYKDPVNSDFRPKLSGPLASMIPAVALAFPIDLNGNAPAGDGTDCSGPIYLAVA